MKPSHAPPGDILIYCRAGFEKECAAEMRQHTSFDTLGGFVRAREGSGYLLICGNGAGLSTPAFEELIFARQMILGTSAVTGLSADDRVTPLLDQATELAPRFSAIWLETADTNEAKSLSALTRKLAAPLERAARQRGLLAAGSDAPRLHVFFTGTSEARIGVTRAGQSSNWLMGIPRLRFPRGAPSRSALKLEEAFLTFLDEPARLLSPGMRAVDLGAAPGGWTWQLVRRHIRVTAVDNGPIDPRLMDSGIVEHLRADAFRYRPTKPVDWMVCDVVEQPSRIAALIARWIGESWARRCIFNLKLPMKRRYDEVLHCRSIIETALDAAGIRTRLRFRQLYHDREEVTGFLDGPDR
ncbi:MAG: 23S rRNA (cytidine(2498)-2'-O)-methyltransferase RlmM [Methylotetracoccus sp.]